MTPSEVIVATTQVGDKTIVECSVCGPVGVTDLPITLAALAHLSPVHGITEMRRVEN